MSLEQFYIIGFIVSVLITILSIKNKKKNADENKKTMQALLFALLSRFLQFIVINALRAFIILLAYLVRWSIGLLEIGLLLIARLAEKVDVRLVPVGDTGEDMNTPAFTEGEIEVMAMRLPKEANTIEKIADYYEISARQARKIKHAVEHRLNVNNYATA